MVLQAHPSRKSPGIGCASALGGWSRLPNASFCFEQAQPMRAERASRPARQQQASSGRHAAVRWNSLWRNAVATDCARVGRML